MIISKEIFNTQSFCNEYLGFYPITKGTKDELRNILDSNGYDRLWDYPLDEVEHIIENNIDVVLVDTTYVDSETYDLVKECRWFAIPE